MEQILHFLSGGFLQLSWFKLVVITLILTHITIVAVTIYLHRSQAHRGLDLHPVVSHFFRFWLWLTTGMITREWVAIHRKHHAKVEREEDPHSPVVYGVERVLWQGAELYRDEAAKEETIKRYSHGVPNDWIERNLYSKHSALGITIMLIIDVLLFGAVGLTIWAIQMAWIPFWAAGVVNGLGHYIGYRNFNSPDTSTNLVPIGILIGGEELHNNHHAYGSSAKFSNRWYEFDIGWMYIKILRFFRLATVKKEAPRIVLKHKVDDVTDSTLNGVITHRYDVMRRYTKMLRRTLKREMISMRRSVAKADFDVLHGFKKAAKKLSRAETFLEDEQQQAVDSTLKQNQVLATVVEMRDELYSIWSNTTASSEQLLNDLKAWCLKAQRSGIQGLEEFALRLRRYTA